MPNVALIPSQNVSIPALHALVDGFPETQIELKTLTGKAPLESGALITDHASPQPDVLELSGSVSDLLVGGASRGAAAFEALKRLNVESEIVQVITPWWTYAEMLLVEVKPRQSGLGMRFSMKLEEVQRVGVTRLTIGRVSGPALERQAETVRGTVLAPGFDRTRPQGF